MKEEQCCIPMGQADSTHTQTHIKCVGQRSHRRRSLSPLCALLLSSLTHSLIPTDARHVVIDERFVFQVKRKYSAKSFRS